MATHPPLNHHPRETAAPSRGTGSTTTVPTCPSPHSPSTVIPAKGGNQGRARGGGPGMGRGNGHPPATQPPPPRNRGPKQGHGQHHHGTHLPVTPLPLYRHSRESGKPGTGEGRSISAPNRVPPNKTQPPSPLTQADCKVCLPKFRMSHDSHNQRMNGIEEHPENPGILIILIQTNKTQPPSPLTQADCKVCLPKFRTSHDSHN